MNVSLLPARTLAAIIDYLIVKSTASLLLAGSALGFFAVAGLYFTAGNHLGASLGKRFFGLSVKDLAGKERLSIPKSFLRFFFLYGIIVCLSEIPRYFYKQSVLVAPSAILDLNMLFSLAYFLSLIFLIANTKGNRGFHDFISSSEIARLGEKSVISDSKLFTKKNIGIIAIACSISLLLWMFSVFKASEAEAVMKIRYQIESQFDLEIAGVEFHEGQERTLFIRCVSDDALTEEDIDLKLTGLSNYLSQEIGGDGDKKLTFRYYLLNLKSKYISEYSFDEELKKL